jgi:hypothetical protein
MLEECENCPLVVLQDQAEDVANFLAALYDGPYVSFTLLSLVLKLSWYTETLEITTKKISVLSLAF